jgi:hypothetical protein
MIDESATKEAGWKYLLLALGVFFVIALEGIYAYGLEPLIYGGIPIREYSDWQIILHWILTCLTWTGAGYLIIRLAKDKLGFDLFEKGEKMKLWQLVVVVLGIMLAVTLTYLDWGGLKIIKEFQAHSWIRSVFQHLYYMVEVALFLLIIVFGQKAFDVWTKKAHIPWGGFLCGLTWGVFHVISRGYFDIANGLFATIGGFLFGAAYLLTNRDIKKSWLILFLMFAL